MRRGKTSVGCDRSEVSLSELLIPHPRAGSTIPPFESRRDRDYRRRDSRNELEKYNGLSRYRSIERASVFLFLLSGAGDVYNPAGLLKYLRGSRGERRKETSEERNM